MVGEQHRDIIPRKLSAGVVEEREDGMVNGDGAIREGRKSVDSRIKVREIISYETGVMETFAHDFKTLILPNIRQRKKTWIIVFSPTGCGAMLEVLGLLQSHLHPQPHFHLHTNTDSTLSIPEGEEESKTNTAISRPVHHGSEKTGARTTFIATIGPTTRDYLISEYAFTPDVVAKRPTPEGVLKGIESFEASLLQEEMP